MSASFKGRKEGSKGGRLRLHDSAAKMKNEDRSAGRVPRRHEMPRKAKNVVATPAEVRSNPFVSRVQAIGYSDPATYFLSRSHLSYASMARELGVTSATVQRHYGEFVDELRPPR